LRVKIPTKDDEKKFTEQLRQLADRAKSELNYNSNRFLGMLAQNGAFATAHILLARSEPSDGFTNMHLAGRVDLTMECLVQRKEWRDFFSASEIKRAQSLTGVGKC
jgi:hypothetical protein